MLVFFLRVCKCPLARTPDYIYKICSLIITLQPRMREVVVHWCKTLFIPVQFSALEFSTAKVSLAYAIHCFSFYKSLEWRGGKFDLCVLQKIQQNIFLKTGRKCKCQNIKIACQSTGWFQRDVCVLPLNIFSSPVTIISSKLWLLHILLNTVFPYGGLWCGHGWGRGGRGFHKKGHKKLLSGGLWRWWHAATERLHGEQPQLGWGARGHLCTAGRRILQWRASQKVQHLCECPR